MECYTIVFTSIHAVDYNSTNRVKVPELKSISHQRLPVSGAIVQLMTPGKRATKSSNMPEQC